MLACQIAHKSWSDSTQLVFFIMTHTKSTLGRVWARYYNWYGMMGKLRAVITAWMDGEENRWLRPGQPLDC